MTDAIELGRHVDAPTLSSRATSDLGPVARTMVIPLWARAAEMRKARPLVNDARALEICDGLDFDFRVFRHAYGTQLGCVLRGLLYDQWVGEFLAREPRGTIVELGAGLTTRFERIDNGAARWVDVDLPDAMALRRRYVTPSPRRTLLAASVLDAEWPARVKNAAPGPYYFVSEGMLMYLAPDAVRALFRRLADAFGGSELAFDSISSSVVRHQGLHDSMKHMMDAPFRWGIEDVREMEGSGAMRIHDVVTLPQIAQTFHRRVPLRYRVVARAIEAALPGFASSYRVARVTLGT